MRTAGATDSSDRAPHCSKVQAELAENAFNEL